jgi:anaerobic selenocysteine-containing dehydrogenase
MKLTRRDFLKDTAVLSAVGALGVPESGKVLHALVEATAPPQQPASRVTYAICPGGGCHQSCPLKVSIQDERVVKVEPADFYKEEPRMANACLKAYASIPWIYNPDRIKYPMKRVGERGSGEWERITWDEALDTIASNLKAVKEKYGSQTVMVKFGGSSTVGNLGGRLISGRFANLWGGGGGSPPGYTTDGGVPAGNLLVFGPGASQIGTDSLDFINSKLLIQWGGNTAESAFREMRHVVEARDSGTKFVVVGVIFDPTAAKADQFIGVRLASDAALALSMMNTIIAEDLYDAEYVKNCTVGPLLVRTDNKQFLRESEVVAGGSEENYMVWDTLSNAAVPVPPGTQAIADVDPALLGSYTVEGAACQPAFQLLVDRAAEYPADKAAEITNVPAETIVDFAREYATTKPACIFMPAGLVRHYHGNIGARAVCTLAAITGNVGVRGGGPGGGEVIGRVRLNTGPISSPEGAPGVERVPDARCEMEVWIAVREGKYPVKAFLGGYRNFMQAYGNARNYKEIFSKLDFIAQIGLFLDMTTSYADVVLPDATVYERADLMTDPYGQYVYLTQPIEPLYESKPNYEIYAEIAKRVGLGEHFTKTPEEWMEVMLQSDNPAMQEITLERLKREGAVAPNVPFKMEVSYADKKFRTASGRIEFYNEMLIPFGEELPVHKENLESPRTSPLAAKYPLSYMTKRKRHFMQTNFSNVDWVRKIEPEPMLDINPVDAAQRGITGGDVVRVYNDRGECYVKARLTQAMPPGLVNIDHGWWPEHFIQGHYNYLTWPIDDPRTVNPVLVLPIIQKDFAAANHTLIYDVLVEVEKVKV